MPTQFVRQIHAQEGETVEIKWRLHDGNLFYERHTVPPKATREAVDPEVKYLDRIGAVSVTVDRTIADRPLTLSGQPCGCDPKASYFCAIHRP